MSTLDMKLQMRAKNHGMTITPKSRPLHRGSRCTQFSCLVRGNKQLTNKQAWDEITGNLFI